MLKIYLLYTTTVTCWTPKHYLNFNHNFAGCGQTLDGINMHIKDTYVKEIYIHLSIYYTTRRLKPTRSDVKHSERWGRERAIVCPLEMLRWRWKWRPQSKPKISMCALCKLSAQQVERTCHTDRLSPIGCIVVVSVVSEFRSIKIMLIKCHFIDGT